MFTIKRFNFALCLIALLNSCFSHRSGNKEFVNKYFNENFDSFKNKAVVIRGLDSERHFILFISNDSEKAFEEGPYMVVIESKTGKIISTRCHLMKDSSNIDRESLNLLAVKFLDYGVSYLDMDKNGNLYINIKSNERPTLIRFSNNEFITDTYKNEWVNIKGNWYEHK